MVLTRFAFVFMALCTLSCGATHIGGTFPGTEKRPYEATLEELAEYYKERTGGLITRSESISPPLGSNIKFTWDPYFKKRIIPLHRLGMDTLQGLFELDQVRFVQDSSRKDFLDASYKFYLKNDFLKARETHDRPYRYLQAWGSLGFPPIKKLTRPLSFYHSAFTDDFDSRKESSRYFDPEFQRQLDRETQTELTFGNKLTALFNGTASYPQKLRFTREAKKFLYVAVMTFIADQSGMKLVDNMIAAKRAGVDVRLITEGFYTFSITNYCVGLLEKAGIPVVRVDDKTMSKMNRMFHDKLWIRDGEEAIIGGMNILNYENGGNGFNFLNRDTDLLVEGPAATNLLDSYVKLWKSYDEEDRPIPLGEYTLATRLQEERIARVRGSENYEKWLGDPETRMKGICRTAVQGNNATPQKIVMLLLRYLEASQHSFYMTSPEIEFDLTRNSEYVDLLARLMREKASRPNYYLAYVTNGFDGALGESTSFLRSRVHDAKVLREHFWEDMLTPLVDEQGRQVTQRTRRTIRPLVDSGVHGFQYFNYMHGKQFYFDRLLVGIGSWNFDGFSADNNHECAIFCLDENLRKQMEEQFVLDMINSVPIVPSSMRGAEIKDSTTSVRSVSGVKSN